jgi:LacI family transcriptional regulator
MRRPTRNDVARYANVSGWTVSNVLNGRNDSAIREETRERVLEAARRLGYRPNGSARALVTGRTCTIAFWMCFNYSQYRTHVLHGLQQQMRNSGFELFIRDIEEEMSRDPDFTRTFQTPVDGIIAFDTPTAGSAFFQVNPSWSVPFVSMGAFWAEGRDFVGVDLYAGAVDALRHLIATGRRRIAYLLPRADEGWANEARNRAYETVLNSAGLECIHLRTPDLSLAASRQTVRDHMTAAGNIDAIFCHNDDMAFGAHRALCDLGIRIGEEVALVGCDGIEETEYLSPPLTTIVQPVEEMCRLAWEFLQARIADPSAPLQQRILKPELVVRASSQA